MHEQPIGHRLRVLRLERGLSMRKVSQLTGLSTHTICRVERGEWQPYDHTVGNLAHAYGVPVDDLLGEPARASVVAV